MEHEKKLVIIESLGLSIDLYINISFNFGEGIAGKCYTEKKPIIINNTITNNNFKNFNFQRENINSLIAFPIIKNEKVLAILNLTSIKPNCFTDTVLTYLDNYAELIINTLENSQIFDQSDKKLNFIDKNTGLYNRSFFVENLRREILRSERYKEIFSLLVIQIANFKKIVKQWEDQKIKNLLFSYAKFLKNTSRRVDTCSSYSLETFAIILPETGKGGALKKAERLTLNTKNTFHKEKSNIELPQIEINCGISSYPEDGTTFESILQHCFSQL
jgi:diguanylate cyclase (GGDEF)-like protein